MIKTSGTRPRSIERSALPLYRQIKNLIVSRIRSGEWAPGGQIPSESELVRTLNVSRMTANRALRELTAEGYLVRVQGVGTFVAKETPQGALVEIRSISDEIRECGGMHSCNVLILREEEPPPAIAAGMRLPPGATLYRSIIVHMDRGVPIQLEDRYVNPSIAPDYLRQDFTSRTPSSYLCSVSPFTEAEHVVEAVLPDRRTQKWLNIGPNEPCLVLKRKTWIGGQLVTQSRFIYPGSRYRIGGRFRPLEPAVRVQN